MYPLVTEYSFLLFPKTQFFFKSLSQARVLKLSIFARERRIRERRKKDTITKRSLLRRYVRNDKKEKIFKMTLKL
ncbi:hypothetical protein DQM68_16780 [Leptospira mayottensis]|uniref:Uncharacterized protein n=2 Tax=Leptospira mayottensis TaxID=1137606 RepID=A0AA87MMM6_9LEPT|nr:hypothetical protein DQM68_16780 [Leptospira mayottensis]AXR62944.1 hypothetical protein DQM28_00405 [Leptospira mayottensis]AZQ01481.1 hypothetical protein LEP1GSC190_04925 [Leptospira mayottensis 200901116]EKR99079.1 hypothetical protein LEP1GSC125_1495 [Leptospira mayottensis 200901122]TGN04048.1 hypothetical protein EHR03_11255 [Leptospira mayottensis]